MITRRYRVVSTGQFTDAVFVSDGDFIGASDEAGAALHLGAQRADIAAAFGEEVEAIDGAVDPWDGTTPLATAPAAAEAPRRASIEERVDRLVTAIADAVDLAALRQAVVADAALTPAGLIAVEATSPPPATAIDDAVPGEPVSPEPAQETTPA